MKKIFLVIFFMLSSILYIYPVSAGVVSDQIEFIKGENTTFYPQNPALLRVHEIRFVPYCDGVLTITSTSSDRVDILATCRLRNLYIQFIVPNGSTVYQPKTGYRGIYYQRILQKKITSTPDKKFMLVLTKPEAVGRFVFGTDKSFTDDNISVDDVADQTIRANIKMIDVETIQRKDVEIYSWLQNVSLSNLDKRMYSNLQRHAKNIGLENLEKKIYMLAREINNILSGIIGGN